MFQRTILNGLLFALIAANTTFGQPITNLGLVGVGRIPANSLDATGLDTLGGIFSSMSVAPLSVIYQNGSWSFLVDAQPDRGFGATADYHPRLHQISTQINPYYGPTPAAQNQITFSLVASDPYVVGSDYLTGASPDDLSSQTLPRSLAGSVGAGKLSFDPEGLVVLPNDERYACDEYGPFIYHFSAGGELIDVLYPPAAYIAKVGSAYPRLNNFLAAMNAATDSGRFENRGFEGLTITPDGTRLVTILQSPLVQDGANKNGARNTRVLVFDIVPGSASYHQPVAEYVYTLTLNGNSAGTRATVVSDILATSSTDFLIIERDAIGLGGDAGPSVYKSVVLASIAGATDIIGTAFDLERGAPGQISLPRSGLPASIQPMSRTEVINLLDPAQLSRFGLSNSTVRDANSLTEKWEGISVVPLNDPDAPEDFLVLLGNDNDFAANPTIHNGVVVGSASPIDSMMMAWRMGRPPYLRIAPQFLVAADQNCSAAMPDLSQFATIIDHTAPSLVFSFSQTPAAGTILEAGVHTVTIRAEANNGYVTTASAQLTVADQTAPVIEQVTNDQPVIWPPNNKMVTVTIGAVVTDHCDAQPTWSVVKVSSNEPEANDSTIVGFNQVSLKAARNGDGTGRVYTITVEAKDASGNVSQRETLARVRHDFSN
jgi:hypothetical protein